MRLIIAVLFTVILAGCQNDLNDIKEFMERQKNIPVPPIDPLPQLKPHEVFEYNPNGQRDPFSNDLEIADESDESQSSTFTEDGRGPDLGRRKEFLESFPLDSLLMVGTYQQDGDYWALIVDPEGTIHRVSIGHYMGHNHGKVTEIYEHEVRILEWLNDGLGAWREREAAMALKEE